MRAMVVACGVVAMATAASAGAGDNERGVVPAVRTVMAVGGVDAIVQPWIHPSMPERTKAKIEAGFELAVERVREVGTCSDLFSHLGADAIETLATGLFSQSTLISVRSRSASETPELPHREPSISPTQLPEVRQPGSVASLAGCRPKPRQ
jgi:hypothetical protein